MIESLKVWMKPGVNDLTIRRVFQKAPYKAEIKRYETKNRSIRYVEVGNKRLPTVLFIHGAPGSSSDFFAYLKDQELLGKVRIVAVDRPGYGESGFGEAVPQIEEQAALILPLLEKLQNGAPLMVLGHSYGGPIAARLAMDYSPLVHHLIMASAAIDPDNEKQFWINKPLSASKTLKSLIPKMFQVAHSEKTVHAEELRLMLPHWGNITMPTIYIHGKKDRIVPYENVHFAQKMLSHNSDTHFVTLEQEGHLYPFFKKGVFKRAIFKHLNDY
jgi:pimeloyl-ACP methyl ester carboxylesterase